MSSVTLLAEANTRFAFDLLEKFSNEDRTGNIFYSPFSISAALAMVRLGAGGNTRAQMSQVLRFAESEPRQPEGVCQQQMQCQMQTTEQTTTQMEQCLTPQNDDAINVDQSFAELLQKLNKPNDSFALKTANRLYGEQSFPFHESYLAETNTYYNAQLETVDFSAEAEAARLRINSWVEEQTNDKIKNLLPPGTVDSLTKLVLVNAIYFKGKWLAQFKEKDTHKAMFQINKKGDKKQVNMMQQTGKFLHAASHGLQALEMPYKGNELSMILILPDEIKDDTTGLEKAERDLMDGNLNDWTRKMQRKTVEVSLPKFKMETRFELTQVLRSLGMEDVFNANMSDLSLMSDAAQLAVTAVVHKAFVEVNEEGTEAAAATGVVIGTTSVSIPVTFKADHPFLFFIRHNASNSVLFAGRYSSPE